MERTRELLALMLCLLAFTLCAGEPAAHPADKPVLLLTGFEPFANFKINPSWEIAKSFEGKEIAGYTIKTALLPVVYDEMDQPLRDAIEKTKPAIVISMGVGTKVVQIETIARNGYHPQRPRDNKSKPPPRSEIVPDAAKQIPTALPADAILKALQAEHIGATLSADAGGYLCNECFYRLMRSEANFGARGFIHVPDFGTKDPEGGVFDMAKLQKAIEVAVKTTAAKVQADAGISVKPRYTNPPEKPSKRDDESSRD
jgi:pyroglutamyl-peptidase